MEKLIHDVLSQDAVILSTLGMVGVFSVCLLPMVSPLIQYWRTLFFFWTGGSYADAKKKLGLSKFSRAHMYSLASVPWLMKQPHYRAGTFQEDMIVNLRNVVLPTGVFGVPLSFCAWSRLNAVMAALFLIPTAAFCGSLYRKFFGLESSATECFARTLMAPTDWLQLWRLNCRLASMTSLATKSRDFEMEDKWKFIQTCLAKKIPVTPVFDMPKTLIAKDVLEEGGLGIHVLKNVLHGGRWILQEKLENCAAVNKLLPEKAPLSTMRVLTCSRGALSDLGADGGSTKAKALATVWRAGRSGANTDHSCVMVNVPDEGSGDLLGTSSTSAHWYAMGLKSLGMPISTQDGSITDHPDTGLMLKGKTLPGAAEARRLCERAHDDMMPGVPLAGWDVAFCEPKTPGGQPELLLLEANLSCNFFRGSIAWEEYATILDDHFAAIDNWRRSGK